jgi:hypothetical protein
MIGGRHEATHVRPQAYVATALFAEPATAIEAALLLDQDLKVVAGQFASRVRLAVDERALGSEHLRGIALFVAVAPSEVRGDRAVALEDAMGIHALVARGDVGTERLGGSPDGISEAAVGRPVAHRQGFEVAWSADQSKIGVASRSWLMSVRPSSEGSARHARTLRREHRAEEDQRRLVAALGDV